MDANGFGMSWTYDGFGRLQAHVDLGGARFSYTYDSAQQLIQQKSTRGQDLAYVYDAAGQQVEVDDYSGPQNDPGFVGPRFPSQITRYQYNEIGQRTLEQIRRGGDIFQDNHLRYDALGRLSSVDDTHMHIGIEYDLLGNRTRISTHVNIPVAAGSAEDKAFNTDRFFRYDEMNRQVLVDGVGIQENNEFVRDASGHYRADITLGQGQILTYDLNGNRLSELKGGKRITESAGGIQGYHAYTMDGSTRLYITEHEGGAPTLFPPSDIGTDSNGATYIISLSHSDGDGLAAFYVFVEPVGAAPTYAVTEGQVQDTYQYDAMNRLVSIIKHDGVTVDQRFYDAAGRTVQQGTGDAVTHEYIAALEPGNASNPSTQATGLDADTRRYRYDAAGELLQQRQFTTLQKNSSSLLGKPGEYEFRRYLGTDYTYDAVGNVIHFSFEKRWEFTNFYDYTSYKRFDTYAADTLQGKSTELLDRNTRNTYDANGRLVSYNNAGVERTLVNDQQGQVVHVVENGQAQRQVVANDQVMGRYGLDAGSQVADFDFGYDRLGANSATTVGSYIIRLGDTLRGIARVVYGDADLWGEIAYANGLSGDMDLHPGQVLSIPPNPAGLHNNEDTLKPFETSRIKGNTTPNLVSPGPGCGSNGVLIAQLVAVVVAVIVATVTVNPGAGWTASNIVGGAIAAGSGALAGEVTSVAIGVKDDINWKGVALSAVGGAVSAGFSLGAGASIPDMALHAAMANATKQGIGVLTGLQDKFDWKGVAASAAGAAAGQFLGKELASSNLDPFAAATLRGFSAGVVTAAAGGGSISARQVAVDAFGTALGESLAAGFDRDPSSKGYRNEMDRQSDTYRPGYNYRNGSDRTSHSQANRYGLAVGAARPFGYDLGGESTGSMGSQYGFSGGFYAEGNATSTGNNQRVSDRYVLDSNTQLGAPLVDVSVSRVVLPGSFGGEYTSVETFGTEQRDSDGNLFLPRTELTHHRGGLGIADDALESMQHGVEHFVQQTQDDGAQAYLEGRLVAAKMAAVSYAFDRVVGDIAIGVIGLPRLYTSNTMLPGLVNAAVHPVQTAQNAYKSFGEMSEQDQVIAGVELLGPVALKYGGAATTALNRLPILGDTPGTAVLRTFDALSSGAPAGSLPAQRGAINIKLVTGGLVSEEGGLVGKVAVDASAVRVYRGVEIIDSTGKPIGEFDHIEGDTFIEDKSARGLNIINPKTGAPYQTADQWAQRQIFEKTSTRIDNLAQAVDTRATIGGTPDVPRISEIKELSKLEFRIENTTHSVQNSVAMQIQALQLKYPSWKFNAKFGG